MLDELFAELNSRMQKAIDGLARELATIRAGRATPALLDNIMVDYQGTSIPLYQLATISIPEANLIIIQPWDRTSLRDIEKAILTANIGLNPANDGNIIRVVIPPLNEERRKELVKLVSRKVEERRIAIRNIRRDGIEKLRELEKNKEISQDELTSNAKKVDQLTEVCVDKVSELGQNKENEIQEI
ncbi:MAG: ribosome recycling factor [Dehalococcoidia bacterium]|jgi:ribosome recycling factor|nr:MAG: ribosome recycling factor [Dehalococcoidia bacterium]TEU18209.1 MAG: ribosome recycling factor [Dehalococcoidia bacterium]